MDFLINNVDLPLSSFSPTLISSYLFSPDMTQPKGKKLEYRLVENYEFEFILESHGAMMLNDKEYPLAPNDIVFRRPGQTTQGILPYKCYAIIFKIDHENQKNFNPEGQKILTYYTNPLLDSIPLIFNTPYSEKYVPLFNLIMKEHINPSVTSDIVFKINILQILNLLSYEITNSIELGSVNILGQHTYVRKALEYVKNNWNQEISLDALANNSGLSKNHFLKIFTKALKLTPNDYITKIRLEKAKQMLAMSSDPINVIAMNCGYDNIPYFSYLFKRKIGLSPVEFRKKYTYY